MIAKKGLVYIGPLLIHHFIVLQPILIYLFMGRDTFVKGEKSHENSTIKYYGRDKDNYISLQSTK